MSEINITVRKIGPAEEILLVKVEGSLDAHTVPSFETKMNKLINEGNTNLLIDAENINYISSAGLGVFMSILDTVEEKGGSLSVLKATDQFTKVFAMMGFDDLFSSYSTEEEAIKGILNK